MTTLLAIGTLIMPVMLIAWLLLPGWQHLVGRSWMMAAVAGGMIMVMMISIFKKSKTRASSNSKSSQGDTKSSKPEDPRLISQVTFARLRSPRFTVTPPPSDFVGRTAELTELLENFGRGVLITSKNGDAGIGTTALARRLAFAVADDYLDGCLEIDLRGAYPSMEEPLDPVEAQRRILRPFYPNEILPDDARALNKLYRQTFSDRQALLLLDNVASGVQLRPLLPRKPSAAIVTSSHADMGLSWSKLYHLQLCGLLPDEGDELLVRISGLDENMHHGPLSKIAEHFEYYPLALRVIASLMKEPFHWSPKEVLKQAKATRKSQVALRGPTAPNLSVDIALEMIHEALPQDLRASLEALSVFPGAFTQTAAAAVWDVDVKMAEETLVLLGRYNLLDYRTTTYSYVQHDLVRLYAQELLLGQMKQTDIVISRYADHILEQAQHANVLYEQDESSTADGMIRFSTLWPDLWKAWNRMNGSDLGWPCPADTHRWLCDFSMKVLAVLNATRPVEERLIILTRTIEAARALEDVKAEMVYQGELGRLYTLLEEAEQALQCHERQLEIAYELRDRANEADALMNIGQACGALGDLPRAKEVWRQAIALFRVLGDERATQVETWLKAVEGRVSAA